MIGLVGAKFRAVLLGPTGLGRLALLQALMSISLLIFGLGGGPAFVRLLSSAVDDGEASRIAALRGAIWAVRLLTGVVCGVLLYVFRNEVSRLFLGSSALSPAVTVILVALAFGFAYDTEMSTLSGYHRVKPLAQAGLVGGALSVASSVTVLALFRLRGVAWSIAVGAGATWIVAYLFRRSQIRFPRSQLSLDRLLASARDLTAFGIPFTASQVFGSGIQFLIPVLILMTLGQSSVGYFQAAAAIAGTYLGFLINAMGGDYYPRVSAIATDHAATVIAVNQQQRLVLLMTSPLIAATICLAPIAVPVVFTAAFRPAVDLLQWMLLGDILKFSAWTISFAILSRSSRLFLVIEAVSGIAYLASNTALVHIMGLNGAGIGWIIYCGVNLSLASAIAWARFGIRWSPANIRQFTASIVALVVIRLAILIMPGHSGLAVATT
ncbi:MAG: oligosaccharide flippase family protein, partial [Candidatus Dormibacteria bacterium]